MREYLGSTKADIVFGQELHAEGERFLKFKADGKKAGWKILGSEAQATGRGGNSGGVFIAAKSRIGMGLCPGGGGVEIVPGRLAAVHLATIAKGGIVGYSVYLWPSEGLSERNVGILRELGEHAASHGKAWVAGGDWNMDPEALCSSRWPERLRAYVKAVTDPMGTCNKGEAGSNIDFFVVERRLVHVVEEPRVDDTSRPNPHRLVEVTIQGKAHTYHGMYRVAPKNVPVKWFVGPRRRPMEEEWGRVRKVMGETKEGLGGVGTGSGVAGELLVKPLEEWTALAENELAASNDIFVEREKYVGRNDCRLAWKPVMGWRAREVFQVSSKTGAAWRWVHSHICEALKLEWSRRRRVGIIQGGYWDQEEVMRYKRITEHLVGLLRKVCRRGAEIAKGLNEGERWSERWGELKGMAGAVASGGAVDVHRLSVWAAEARAKAEADELLCRGERVRGWKKFSTEAVKGGGRRAHRWLKGPQSWHPEYAGGSDDPQYGPQEIGEQCMEWWSEIWGCGNGEEGEEALGVCAEVEGWLMGGDWCSPELPVISGEMVKRAASSFKDRTGKGFCGWHPKVFNQLPEAGLQATAELLMLIEKARRWPTGADNIDLIRLSKEAGGHRLIGLLPALYRVWGKLRRPLCAEWEERHRDPCDFAVSGRSAPRAAWDFAVENEACTSSGGQTVCWQGDMEKCYELVPFTAILGEAKELEFPAGVAFLATAMYAGRRRVVVDQVYSSARRTTKGIVAGCSVATTLVKVCVRRFLKRLGEKFPTIIRRIFLDDLAAQWKGRKMLWKRRPGGGRVVVAPKKFVEAVKYCVKELAEVIGAKISGKSRFLASNKDLLRATVRECEKEGLLGKGEGASVSKYMGVDYAAAVQVTGFRPARKKRWEAAKKKVRRARQLKKGGAEVGGIWAAGPGASMGYGAEVFGVNGGVLEAYRKVTGAAVLGDAAGRSLTVGFLLEKKGGRDPMHSVGIAPIYAWALEAWRRRGNLSTMKVAWRGVRERMATAKRLWAAVRGPAAATWASLHRLGWKFVSPFTVVSDVGKEYDLLEISPKRLKRRLHEGVDRWGWRKVLREFGYGEEEAGLLAARVRKEWAVDLLHKHGDLSPQEKGALRRVLEGSVWTEERCWEEGYLEYPLCKVCLAGVGNTQHRAYGCGELAVSGDMVLKEAWREEGRKASKRDPYWTRLIPMGTARARLPRAEEVHMEWIGEAQVITGEVFGDGSVKGRGELGRGGSAFGVLKSTVEEEILELEDHALGGGWTKLGGEDHSSTDAELGALVACLRVATPPVHYITDCMSIVRGVRDGVGHTTNPDRLHADWWRRIWELVGDWVHGSLTASHVKAHRGREAAASEGEVSVRWWHGNKLADVWAGHAAEANRVGADVAEELRAEKHKYGAVARWVGQVTARCAEVLPHDKVGKLAGWARERRPEKWRVPRHELARAGARMKCVHCAQEAGTKLAIRRLKALPCWGSVIHRVGVFGRKKGDVGTSLGHLLRVSWPCLGGEAVVWCAVCGLYAQKAPRGLVKPCKGVASRAGKANLAAFNRNRHPKCGVGLSDGLAFLPEGMLPTRLSPARQEVVGSVIEAVGVRQDREEGRGEEAVQGAGVREVAFEEPPDQEYERWAALGREDGGGRGEVGAGGGVVDEAGGGGCGGGAGGLPSGEAGEPELGGAAGVGEDAQEVRQKRRRPNIYSIGGVMLGEEIAHQVAKSTSTKRSKFRF